MVTSRINADELKRLLTEDKSPGRLERIANHFGVKRDALHKAIRKAGLSARPILYDPLVIAQLIKEDRLPGRVGRIAKKLNLLEGTVSGAIRSLPDSLKQDTDIIKPEAYDYSEELKELIKEFPPGQRGRVARISERLGISHSIASFTIKEAEGNLGDRREKRKSRNVGDVKKQREVHGCLNKTRQYRKDPRQNLVREAMHRAIEKGYDFDLHPSDITIPDICPVLGIPIIVGAGKFHPNCPNLDRVDSRKGYTWDNVLVVSCRANSIKKDATAEELQKLASFYTNYEKPSDRAPIQRIRASTQYKLNPEKKNKVKEDFTSGLRIKDIAHKYKLSCRIVWEIIHDPEALSNANKNC